MIILGVQQLKTLLTSVWFSFVAELQLLLVSSGQGLPFYLSAGSS